MGGFAGTREARGDDARGVGYAKTLFGLLGGRGP